MFIDGISIEKELLKEDIVISFFHLNQDENRIYQMNDHIFRRIFRYLTLNEIFKNITLVCYWFKKILYESFIHIDISIIKKMVYFGNNIIKLDSFEDFNLLLRNFKLVRNLKLMNIEYLNDKIWNDLSKEYFKLKSIHLIKTSLIQPKFTSNKLLSLDLSHSKYLINIKLNSYHSLLDLNLSNTSISDSNLKNLLENLKNLKNLFLKQCDNLKSPIFIGDELLEIYLDFSNSLTKPDFHLLKKCEIISLNFTPINDESLLFESNTLKILYLNGCNQLLLPIISFNSLLELYLSFCSSINNKNILEIFNKKEDDIIINCKNLIKIDIRNTNLNINKIKQISFHLKDILIN